MVIGKFFLVALVLCVGFTSGQPSKDEFNLFCRILAEADRMITDVKDYVYDENVDRKTIQEMAVLYNATTDDMNEFRKTLWVTKDFFEAHPPPTQPESRKKARREIGNLIKDGEKKIEENQKIAEEVNEKIKEAKLSVAKGIFGENVAELPKQDGNLTKILNDTGSIFNDNNSARTSCGDKEHPAGKTLLNDFFCVCVGDGEKDGTSEPPCSPNILPPRHGDNKNGWKAMKYKSGNENKVLQFNESFKQIEKVCTEELLQEMEPIKNMDALLGEYVGMIGMGDKKTKKDKKIFGHSERSTGGGNNQVTECTGAGSWHLGGPEKRNDKICVDYTNNQNNDKKTYNITWHEKFKNYTTIMQDAKKIEERILKNRADLLLLKSEAWIAYSREKDDETSNLDDMNASPGKNTMTEKKAEKREYIDVSEETTQPSQPSQPVQGQGAPGNPPHYILISSTETSQPSPKKTDEGKGGGREEPEVTVISSESATQEAPSPNQGPSQATSQPPTHPPKRLREEKKTGE